MADSVTGVTGASGAGGAGGSSNPFGSMMVDVLEQSLSSNGQPPTGETKKALDTLRDALKGNQKDAAQQSGEGGGQPAGGAEGAGAPQGSQGGQGKGKTDTNGILQMLQQIMQMLQQLMQMVSQGAQGGQGQGGEGGQPGFEGTPGATEAAGQLPSTPLDQVGDSLVDVGEGLDDFAQTIPA